MPSARMTALLGLLAVAGYQNRHRLAEMFGIPAGQNRPNEGAAGQTLGTQAGAGGLGGLLGGLLGGSGSATGASPGSTMTGGLQDIIDSFTGSGNADVAKSWVSTGPNRELESGQLEAALGEDTIDSLTQQTGLSREELLSRLQAVLPAAVDKMTPDGRIPTA